MFTTKESKILLDVAKNSILFGLKNGTISAIDALEYPENLQKVLASFVTLKISNQLRGCIGTLYASQPLVLDVCKNAYFAAFQDYRFPPLKIKEFEKISISISVLSVPEKIEINNEQDLLNQLQVGKDGLILKDKCYSATFLPSVWEQIPNKSEFLKHLKIKAGLNESYWSDTITFEKYHSYLIEDLNKGSKTWNCM